jgi:hypothetical protein
MAGLDQPSARGQAGNLIKLHKTQLVSDRTTVVRRLANQVRLVLHIAAQSPLLDDGKGTAANSASPLVDLMQKRQSWPRDRAILFEKQSVISPIPL